MAAAGYGEPPAHPAAATPGKVLTGIDVLEADGFQELQGRRIGLITNHTGRDSEGRTTAEVLAGAKGVTLVALFSPEHGFNGAVEDCQGELDQREPGRTRHPGPQPLRRRHGRHAAQA